MSDFSGVERVRPMELLLVEDSFGDAMLAQEAFTATQALTHLSIAGDGEEALKKLRREDPYADWPRPDLILLDLNLPRMDGRSVLTDIKTDPALRTIPVIVMTGSSAVADVHDSYALGANGYIVKPIYFEHLEEIAAAIDRFWFGVAALPSRTPPGQADVA